MKVDTVEEIRDWLTRAGSLTDALMEGLRLVDHGYSVRIDLKLIVDVDGCVLAEPVKVCFDLLGVQHFSLNGSLSVRMIEHPEEIDWGLSEVALVELTRVVDGVRFQILWEGERNIEILCRQAVLVAPG